MGINLKHYKFNLIQADNSHYQVQNIEPNLGFLSHL